MPGPAPACACCGYNLTGICTPVRPTGVCPECGTVFERAQLLERHLERASFPLSFVVLQLLLFPVIIVFTPVCCVGTLWDSLFLDEPSDAAMTLVFVGMPLFAAFLAGGLIARQYYPGAVLGVPPERRRGLKRHIILPWLLFFLIEAVLAVVYFFGGCALLLAVFGLL